MNPIAAGSFVMALIAFTVSPPPAPAVPSIQWTPSSIDETILAGETKTVPVSFTASKDLTDVVVRVVPELEPYVQVDPAVIGNVSKGQIINLDPIVSAPATSLLRS